MTPVGLPGLQIVTCDCVLKRVRESLHSHELTETCTQRVYLCGIAWIIDYDLRLRVETSLWVIAFSRTHRDVNSESISMWIADCDLRLCVETSSWVIAFSRTHRDVILESISMWDCWLWSTIVRWNEFVSHCILTNSQRRDLREYIYVELQIMIYDCALKQVRESLHSHELTETWT